MLHVTSRLFARQQEQGMIKDMSCARIEHVLSGTWLHGSKGKTENFLNNSLIYPER